MTNVTNAVINENTITIFPTQAVAYFYISLLEYELEDIIFKDSGHNNNYSCYDCVLSAYVSLFEGALDFDEIIFNNDVHFICAQIIKESYTKIPSLTKNNLLRVLKLIFYYIDGKLNNYHSNNSVVYQKTLNNINIEIEKILLNDSFLSGILNEYVNN